MFVSLYAFENNSSNTHHFYIVHEDTGLFACAKGWSTNEATRIRLECPKQIEDALKRRLSSAQKKSNASDDFNDTDEMI
jgi:hypothetical protein